MSFRILPGLPPYGPAAVQFSETGQGKQSEGLVVEFEGDTGGTPWTGNFHRGMTRYDDVLQVAGSPELTIVAGGTAYVVNQKTRQCLRTFGGDLHQVLRIPGGFVLSNGLWLEAKVDGGLLWRSRRISWDGFQDIRVEGDRIVGEAFTPMGERWEPFEVDVRTGEVIGGTFPGGAVVHSPIR